MSFKIVLSFAFIFLTASQSWAQSGVCGIGDASIDRVAHRLEAQVAELDRETVQASARLETLANNCKACSDQAAIDGLKKMGLAAVMYGTAAGLGRGVEKLGLTGYSDKAPYWMEDLTRRAKQTGRWGVRFAASGASAARSVAKSLPGVLGIFFIGMSAGLGSIMVGLDGLLSSGDREAGARVIGLSEDEASDIRDQAINRSQISLPRRSRANLDVDANTLATRFDTYIAKSNEHRQTLNAYEQIDLRGLQNEESQVVRRIGTQLQRIVSATAELEKLRELRMTLAAYCNTKRKPAIVTEGPSFTNETTATTAIAQ